MKKRTQDFTSTWRPPADVRSALRRGEKRWKAHQVNPDKSLKPERS